MNTIKKLILTLLIALGATIVLTNTAYAYTSNDIESLEQQLVAIEEKQKPHMKWQNQLGNLVTRKITQL